MSETLTPRQEASRRNGSKSRGPVTTEGKAISCKNAIKHGIFAAPEVILPNESMAEFEAEIDELAEEYDIQGLEDLKAVVSYVTNHWRLERCWEMENQAAGLYMADVRGELAAKGIARTEAQLTFLAYERADANSTFFAKFSLYESRLRRACDLDKRDLAAILVRRAAKAAARLEQPVSPAVANAEAELQAPVPAQVNPQTVQNEIRKKEPAPIASRLPGTARNKPCPCGSGQKYKRCCLINPPKAA